jgi:hypothetical protein
MVPILSQPREVKGNLQRGKLQGLNPGKIILSFETKQDER